MGSGSTDWTGGAAKYAAVFVLGAASATGVVWSMLGGGTTGSAPQVPSSPTAAPQVDPPVSVEPMDANESDEVAGAEADVAEVAVGAPRPDGLASPSKEAEQPSSPLSLLVDLNTASAEELDVLPGIGPAIAARIIEDRQANGPFRTLEDLARVRGIGPRTIERLRGKATASVPHS